MPTVTRWILLVVLACNATAAVRWVNGGVPLRRTDYASMKFRLNAATASKLGPDALATVQASLDSWNAVPGTALHFMPVEATTLGIAADGQNVIAFADTAGALAEVGQRVAATHLSVLPDGTIAEADIILNPNYPFSTVLTDGAYDLRTVVTHELGHALGANHSTVASAAMFWNTPPRNSVQATLKDDDIAFAVEVYPGPGALSGYGTLAGRVMKDGAAANGAAVIAVDPASGVTIGGVSSLADGSFSLRVPAGNYVLFAGPLAPMIPPGVMYGMDAGRIDSSMRPSMSPSDGSTLRVDAGATVAVSLAVLSGASALSVEATAGIQPDGFGGLVVMAGKALDMVVLGAGLDGTISESDVQAFGDGVSLRPGTLRVDQTITYSDGRHPLRLTLDTTPSSKGTASLLFTKGIDRALLAGGVMISPLKPFFTESSVANAASAKAAPVAPGELISIYGTAVGPDSPALATEYDAVTGGLPTRLGNVQVSFDGVPAPLLVVTAQQINVQVPYEVRGKAFTNVVVTRSGVRGDPVTLQVVESQPGIFTATGTAEAVAVNNETNTLNSASAPASKGSYVILYVTGTGDPEPGLATGKPAPVAPLCYTPAVSATAGGKPAEVYQTGVMAPGFVGLAQVAIKIPESAPSGKLALAVSVGGRTSNEAIVFVR